MTAMDAMDLTGISAGLLVGRLMVGLGIAAHGSQKLFGWFGGYGLAGTGGFFEQLGFRPGRIFAAAAGGAEFAGGLLTALGLLGPVGPALMLSVMIVAKLTVHFRNGFFTETNGIERPFLYAAGALVFGLAGPGLFSLDAVLGLEWLWAPRIGVAALTIGVLGAIGNVLARRPVASAGTAAVS